MLKDIKGIREINLNCALSGDYVDANDKWVKMDTETAQELFELCKEYVAKTARGKRRERINSKTIGSVARYGIFNRLVYNYDRQRVEYICGQDWDSEMATLRDCFDK